MKMKMKMKMKMECLRMTQGTGDSQVIPQALEIQASEFHRHQETRHGQVIPQALEIQASEVIQGSQVIAMGLGYNLSVIRI